jgi:hypothetical protein
MACQPILVLVPGSFSWSYQYDALVEPLRAKGHIVHVLDPPCYPAGYIANPANSLPTMYDDAKFINEFVSKLVDDGKQVVLLAHSYGGRSAHCLSPMTASRASEMKPRKPKYGCWLMFERNIGCPASESLKGVTKKEREQQDKKGGVVRIAYLTAAVPRLNESVGQTIKGGKAVPIDVGEVYQFPSSSLPHYHKCQCIVW